MKCFLGIQPKCAFGEPGDSGALVFDGQGKAVGIFSATTNHTQMSHITPPDISHVIPLEDIFEDLRELGLMNIKFANDL